ncbi:MAG: lytic murein transglycosylase B [Gammaproteobacteria bacterium]|nr:lytic murein transglycosylase B [Gammaproteobacteria bacterium]NIR84222.1 lytic murein transglycosylase B [Gammaproteobacteria bacterium]NIR89692.1 lytic murein transglycosylase B [Gammaproteobacteria bacterium]NIU05380.1 lytic murein transglycosylase B [Gammaproteobacteria bacterium]NIV52326.1 lytic murein transglycosylase B [Gammaproteobacteria bacterium]
MAAGRLGALLLACLIPTLVSASAAERLGDDPAVHRFIDAMAGRHGFDPSRLQAVFRTARVDSHVLEAISRPAEAKPWYLYRSIFLTPTRIDKGAKFWRRHREVLARAAAEYGVDPEFIVAILGVETRYGDNTGRIRVLDALSTLAFRYPRRSTFFLSELEEFLLLTREEALDPLALRGSYAGAMGLPQFIASSYRRYAVDFDGDNVRDLLNNPADSIGSVANYLKVHGWESDGDVAVAATVPAGSELERLKRGLKPHTRIGAMKAQGLKLADPVPEGVMGALIELDAGERTEYWVGLQNFYTITRYNHSALYAMAVYQLAQAIRDVYQATEVR